MAETVRAETYPAPDMRAPEIARHSTRAPDQVDSAITREFAARTAAAWGTQKRAPAPNGAANPAAENLEELIRRIAGVSLAEIEQTIHELEVVRDVLISEGERVGREVTSYANLSQSAALVMKDVASTINGWKSRSDAIERRPAP